MTIAAASPESTISCDANTFRENFNRRPFEIQHSLAGNPLFEIPRLIELAKTTADRKNPHRPFGDAYCLIGTPEPGQKTLDSNRVVTSIAEAMSQIENSQAWIVLAHIEREAEYREVFENYICDLLELTGAELLRKIKWFQAIAFVTSPGRATNYHLDRECAWLLQLKGDKEIHLFDKSDKEIVPDEELEEFWASDNGSSVYKPQYESRAMVFNMKPGTGVHIPVNCPHWLRNGNEVSVSINLNFAFHDHLWGNIYKANYHLRKRGIQPSTPGNNSATDLLKSVTYTTAQKINFLRKGKQEIPPEAREQFDRVAQRMAQRSAQRA